MSAKPNHSQEEYNLVYNLLRSMLDGSNRFEKKKQNAIADEIGVTYKDMSLFVKNPDSFGEKASQAQKNRVVEQTKKCYSEQLLQLQERIEAKEFDIYIYYYFSYDNVVKPALMKIAKNGSAWSIAHGEIIYYSKNEKTKQLEELIFSLNMTPEFMAAANGQPQVAFFKAVNPKKNQVNFFTVNVKGLAIESRHVMFLTYSVVETQNNELSCGNGILIKEENEDNAKDKIKKIIESNVDDWVINALYGKKMSFGDLEHDAYKTEKDLLDKHPQYIASKELSAYYVGYFLSSGEFGEVIKAVLKIRKNGIAHLYYNSYSEKLEKFEPTYEGFLYFPTESYNLIKGSFAYHNKHRTYRYQMFLDATRAKLKGVFSGWTKGLSIYSTPVFFERITEIDIDSENGLAFVIKKYNPRRIPKKELEKNTDLINELREKFTPLFKDYIINMDDCIPFPYSRV